MVGGYTLILVIDKVLFDAHDILDHDDMHDFDNNNSVNAIRKSIT
jgi:hypothetical protein